MNVPEIGPIMRCSCACARPASTAARGTLAGLPYLIRVAGYGLRTPKVAGLGTELAGVVEAVGCARDGAPTG